MKILLIDDHPLYLSGLQLLLQRHFVKEEILQSTNSKDALDILTQYPPQDWQMILLDLNLPGLNGKHLLKIVRRHLPRTPIIILSGEDVAYAEEQRLLREGADSILNKSLTPEQLISRILQVVTSHMSKPLKSGVSYDDQEISHNHHDQEKPTDVNDMVTELTPRQLEVLQLVFEGKTNSQIAEILEIAESTVKSHLQTLYRYANAKNRTSLIRIATALGLLRG